VNQRCTDYLKGCLEMVEMHMLVVEEEGRRRARWLCAKVYERLKGLEEELQAP
jgi:hypothetical protein